MPEGLLSRPNRGLLRWKFGMRLIFRILGTWLLGLALILAVVDGTKSLASNEVVMTPLLDIWSFLSPSGLDAARAFFASRFFGTLLEPVFESVLTYPAFGVAAVPGIVFALLGRSRYPRRYIRQDQL